MMNKDEYIDICSFGALIGRCKRYGNVALKCDVIIQCAQFVDLTLK